MIVKRITGKIQGDTLVLVLTGTQRLDVYTNDKERQDQTLLIYTVDLSHSACMKGTKVT